MRKHLLGAALASALGVAGCATSGTGSTITVASVQSAAVTACSYLPTAATITNILTANPIAATAESIAAIICGAVTSPPAVAQPAAPGAKLKAAAPVVVVNGKAITVHGAFVAGGAPVH